MQASFCSEYLGSGRVPQALTGTLACWDRCDTTVNGSLNIKDVLFPFFSLLTFPLPQPLSFLLLEQCCGHSSAQEAAHRICHRKPAGCAISDLAVTRVSII